MLVETLTGHANEQPWSIGRGLGAHLVLDKLLLSRLDESHYSCIARRTLVPQHALHTDVQILLKDTSHDIQR
jgi:hypothetical protein